MNFIVIYQNDDDCPIVFGPGTFGDCLGKFSKLVDTANGTLHGGETEWTNDNGIIISIGCIEPL